MLPEPEGSGIYHYSVGCEFECNLIGFTCRGKSKEVELIVKVVGMHVEIIII